MHDATADTAAAAPPAALLMQQIQAASTVSDLQQASVQMDRWLVQHHHAGTAIVALADQATDFNRQLFLRLWQLLAPPGLIANSALLVLGSEGRGEQLLKTDQDNALLLRDGFEWPGLAALTAQFSAALADIGCPPCPGGVMLSRPLWCQPLAAFRETLRGWIYDGRPEGPMDLAIFLDAVCVAGDASLLAQARAHVDHILGDQDAFLSQFAAAADSFQEPGHWFAWLKPHRDEQALDLKKLGLFPIVHGVRALALQHGVHDTGTGERVARLTAGGGIDAPLAHAVLDALHGLMALRLAHQLRQQAAGVAADNLLRPAELDASGRAQLQQSLATVKRFKAFLRQHFHLVS